MAVYLPLITLMLGASFLLATNVAKLQKTTVFLASLTAAIAIFGFRYDVATDYYNYVGQFESINRFGFDYWVEPGWIFIILSLTTIGVSYYFIFPLIFVFTITLMYVGFKKFALFPSAALLIYVVSYAPNNLMGGIRISLACGVLSFATWYAMRKKIYVFVGVVALAALVHRAAVLFLVAYPLIVVAQQRRYKALALSFGIFYLILTLLAPVLTLALEATANAFSDLAGQYAIKTRNYLQREPLKLSLTGYVKNLILSVYFLFFCSSMLARKQYWYLSVVTVVIFGYVFSIAASGTPFSYFAMRGASFYTFLEAALLLAPLKVLRSNIEKTLVGLFALVVAASSFFSKVVQRPDAFFPYTNVLLENL